MTDSCVEYPEEFFLPAENAVQLYCTGRLVNGKWEWSLDKTSGSINKKIPIKLDKDSGPHRIVIDLEVPPGGPSFQPNEPLWYSTTRCPLSPEFDSDQIIRVRVTEQGKRLTFLNLNEGLFDDIIYYALRFTVGDPFDPMFKNGGGK